MRESILKTANLIRMKTGAAFTKCSPMKEIW